MKEYTTQNMYDEIVEVNLNTIERIKKFGSIVSKFDSDIDVMQERHISDAKSVIALFTFDVTKPVKIGILSSSENELNLFREAMKEFTWEG